MEKGRRRKTLLYVILLVFLMLAALLPAQAAVISFNGVVGGQAQDVTLNYTFGLNSLSLSLTNNLVDPPSVMGALSQIDFSVTGGLSGALTSATGTMIDVFSDGTYSVLLGNPDWYQLGPGFLTTGLGSSGPDNTLIGQPGAGSAYHGNSSILGNGPHNPFAQGTVTLVYNIPGASSRTGFTDLSLGFGTAPTTVPLSAPEPATFWLAGAVFALAAFRRLAYT